MPNMMKNLFSPFIRYLRQLGKLLRIRNLPGLLRKLMNDGFLRNVAVLASGTMISQVIVMATLPVLTRLYSPTEYGTYSMYLSIIGILLMVISFPTKMP